MVFVTVCEMAIVSTTLVSVRTFALVITVDIITVTFVISLWPVEIIFVAVVNFGIAFPVADLDRGAALLVIVEIRRIVAAVLVRNSRGSLRSRTDAIIKVD